MKIKRNYKSILSQLYYNTDFLRKKYKRFINDCVKDYDSSIPKIIENETTKGTAIKSGGTWARSAASST